MTAIFDIETDGLYAEATKIHCISLKIDDQPTQLFDTIQGNIKEALDILSNADVIVAHNGINFDIPTIQKLYPEWTYRETLDTLLISKLMFPNMMDLDMRRKSVPGKLKGRHSLKAWGYRLRLLKGDFGESTDWKDYSQEMGEYCKLDVDVTYKLLKKLEEKGMPPKEAIWLEQEFAKVISRQEKFGVWFDLKKAEKLHIELLQEKDKAEEKLLSVFTPLKDWKPLKKHKETTAKGLPNKNHLGQIALGACYNDDGEWGRWVTVEFNPGSRQHIARWLQEVYNWKPTEYTDKGSIIINETVLNGLDFPEGKILAHYFNVTKLLGQLAEGKNAWLKQVKDGRIHGRVDTLGAVSRRCTHSTPNMAQVPSVRAYKGTEARGLFSVPKGKKLIGCDMSGLELRVFAHYLARFDKGKYADVILNGDIHTYNQQAAGLPTRDNAKTFIYGTLYGAGDSKVGEIVGKDAEEGKRLKAMFNRNVPAYKKLCDQVAQVYKEQGYLKALDGTPYHIRSSHSALNTLLQGAGALLCKVWLILTDIELQEKGYKPGIDYEFVINCHDEFQTEVTEGLEEEIGAIILANTTKAGEYFNLRIRLDGEVKIGNNWADCH